jgi:hypothetical protein
VTLATRRAVFVRGLFSATAQGLERNQGRTAGLIQKRPFGRVVRAARAGEFSTVRR